MRNTDDDRTSKQIVYDCIVDLYNAEQFPTREVIQKTTGRVLTTVDDRLKTLCDDEQIHRLKRGAYVPVVAPPKSRPVSVTYIESGLAKVEVGDAYMEVWPREARRLGQLLCGAALEYSNIQAGHEATMMITELVGRIKRLERQLATALAVTVEPKQMKLELLECMEDTPSRV